MATKAKRRLAEKPEDWEARAEAYQEAAEHLLLEWTDDPNERAQGEYVSRLLLKQADDCRHTALVRKAQTR